MTSSSTHKKYDLVVIGSGPGGQRAAIQAAKLSKKVLVVEKEKLGGSCLHWGTIPSKTLREAVLKCSQSDNCDISIIEQVLTQTRQVIAEEESIIQKQFTRNHVDLVFGTASFVSENEILVEGDKTSIVVAEKVIIATGTKPFQPREMQFDQKFIFDSDTILKLNRFPKSIAVLGAGVIGCEYASIFANLEINVTLIDQRNVLLRGVDAEINQHLMQHFQKHKIQMELGAKFDSFKVTEKQNLSVTLNGKSQSFDLLLVCMGRSGNSSELKLRNVGIEANNRGLITVNEFYQTSQKNIYAVGDIIGAPALAASSEEQGRMAAAHAFDLKTGKFPSWFPYGIYTIPEISMVGPCEEELKEKGIEYVVGRAFYKELARGKILGDNDGLLKLIVEKKSKKLLSVHCLGTGATELVHIGQVAIALEATIDFLVDNIFNYPTLAEAYKVAAYNAYNQLR